jgi:hypothetical protein
MDPPTLSSDDTTPGIGPCGLQGDHARGYIMRTFLPAVLACLALASVIGGRLIAATAGGSPAKIPAPASPPPAAAPRPAPAAGSSIDNDAPARHARRTACLKDAKSKKLVGVQRDAYVKNCVGAL